MWTWIKSAWDRVRGWVARLFGRRLALPARDIPLIERKKFSCKVGTSVSYQVSFYSGENVTPVVPPTSYEIFNLPPGLDYDRLTGLITGVPTTVGEYGVTIQALGPGPVRQSTGVLFTIRSA